MVKMVGISVLRRIRSQPWRRAPGAADYPPVPPETKAPAIAGWKRAPSLPLGSAKADCSLKGTNQRGNLAEAVSSGQEVVNIGVKELLDAGIHLGTEQALESEDEAFILASAMASAL